MTEGVPKSSAYEKPDMTMKSYFKFLDEDQKAMRSGTWDYKNPKWVLNQWKDDFERVDDSLLSDEGRQSKWNALWLWYHHASQFAYKEGDTQTALVFIDKALEFREKGGLTNQITPLLKLLYLGDVEGAKAFAATIPQKREANTPDGRIEVVDNPERTMATELIAYYEAQSPND